MIATRKNYSSQSGQVLIVTLVLFIAVGGAVTAALVSPVLKSAATGRTALAAEQSYFTAEAGTEDVLYRLRSGLPVSPTETLTVGSSTASVSITDAVGGKTVVAQGDQNNYLRKVETKVVAGVGASFNYGVQVGQGGFTMSNNAGVIGNVYANGNITGDNSAYITGSAIAANSAALVTDQANETPLPPTQSIVFRNTSTNQDLAQSFQVSTTSPINKVQFYLKKTGGPADATVRLTTDNAGSPSASTLASGALSAAQVTTNYGWIEVVFTTNPQLTPGTTYWLVIDNSSQSASNYYTIAANTAYGNGTGKIGQYGGVWNNTSPTGLDSYFRFFLGGLTSTIDKITVGTGSTGDAWAHTVTNSTVRGNLYCQTGSSNNKACNTSQPDPAPQPFPLSDANIQTWKDEGAAGTLINGNYTPSGSTSTLGPAKITGNLTITNNHVLTLTGTVWVMGDVDVSNNASIKLSSAYGQNSGVLVTDGQINVSNNGTFDGSGQTGSYLLLVTTSNCSAPTSCGGNPAINVNNNAGTVILNAQKGRIQFDNNAGTKEAVAYQISLSNNAVITYDTGLANVNFVSGPSGGWNITSWKEVE